MNEGEKTVILVRAQSLSDALRSYVRLVPLYPLALGNALAAGTTVPDPAEYLPERISWEAQRLLSSVERALGTRERHYDPKEAG